VGSRPRLAVGSTDPTFLMLVEPYHNPSNACNIFADLFCGTIVCVITADETSAPLATTSGEQNSHGAITNAPATLGTGKPHHRTE